MSAIESSSGRDPAPWTCPFCPLLCDRFSVAADAGAWVLQGSDCARARAGLARFGVVDAPAARPQVDGVDVEPETAIAAAARLLAASRQPLFGGLGTDAAGARALYPLACRTGAISDPAGGASLMQSLRALQDRGAFTTTFAEVCTRADLIVCIGAMPTERYPEFLRRCGVGDGGRDGAVDVDGARGPARVVLLQPASVTPAVPVADPVEVVRFEGDLFDAVAMLAACVAGRAVGAAAGPIAALAAELHTAKYAVLAYEAGQMPPQGALVIEAINRVVSTLNKKGRAAALAVGGGDGASTVNAVFTWLSGLPLRSRAAPSGLEHEPLRFDSNRLLADGAVDALLWIASFGSEPAPPSVALPRIVLGHPTFAEVARGCATVFIPVSTPGIGSAGHLFRTDGSVLMPLRALRADALPTVADVLKRLTSALAALQGAAA